MKKIWDENGIMRDYMIYMLYLVISLGEQENPMSDVWGLQEMIQSPKVGVSKLEEMFFHEKTSGFYDFKMKTGG